MGEIEEWKEVKGFPYYEISNYGRLRSIDRPARNGNGAYIKKGRMLKLQQDKLGYYSNYLVGENGKKACKIHRLVAQAFIPNPESKPCVNHIDNNPSNNYYKNLEWCTMKENSEWMCKQGRNKRTKEWLDCLHKAKEKEQKAVVGEKIDGTQKKFFSGVNETAKYGFSPSCVCKCCQKKPQEKVHKGWYFSYADEVE